MKRRTFLAASVNLTHAAGAMQNTASANTPDAGGVIVQAGRRPDPADAKAVRFPVSNVDVVRERIKKVFQREKPYALVSGAACGTDLLALGVAAEMSVQRVVLLPSPPAEFRTTSVIDRPGNWGPLFDKLVKEVKVEVASGADGQESYLEINLKLLDRAQVLAAKHRAAAIALVVWDGESRGADDVTAHFLTNARARKLRIIEVRTL